MNGLFQALGHEYNPNDWHLFIDSSKLSLKAVLSQYFPICSYRVCHSYEWNFWGYECNTKMHWIYFTQWHICIDLKVVGLLMGMQQGYTKYCCFSCESDSNDKVNHYFSQEWPARLPYCPFLESNCFPWTTLNPQDVFLPPYTSILDWWKYLWRY